MIQFDLRGRLPFNIEHIYAHGEAESLIAESRRDDECNAADLISCDIDFNALLIGSKCENAIVECSVLNVPSLAIVWEYSDRVNRIIKIHKEFDEKKLIAETITKGREMFMRLATEYRDMEISRCVREYKGLVCLKSDSHSIQDAIDKMNRMADVI